MTGLAFARMLASLPEFSSDYVWAKAETLDKVARLYEQATEETREALETIALGRSGGLSGFSGEGAAIVAREVLGWRTSGFEYPAPSEPATRVDQADGAGDESK